MDANTLQPLGPEAIRARMDQIRGSLNQPKADKPAAGTYSGIAGSITSKGSFLAEGNTPFDPTGAGVGLSGGIAPADIKAKIELAARNNGVDPALLDAIVQAESGYDPTSVSKVGAKGLTQLMPQTAAEMGVTNPFDPDQALQGGAKYLSSLLRQFPRTEDAVAAYNAGPGAVIRHGGIPNYAETQGYVRRVMGIYRGNKA